MRRVHEVFIGVMQEDRNSCLLWMIAVTTSQNQVSFFVSVKTVYSLGELIMHTGGSHYSYFVYVM